jgi:carboxyl-terminal processing protease
MRHYKTVFQNFGLKISTLAALTALLRCSAFGDTLPTNAPVQLTPGPNDGRIAYVTARLMEEYHYSQQPLDEKISEKFFDGYLETLDPQHLHFLQSDIAGFAHYRTHLDTLTVNDSGSANLKPAYEIYQRFLERLQQHVAYVDDLLKHDKFRFNTDERILLDRRDAPYPKNLVEAKRLWRQRLLFEYLQEKLNREFSPTNDAAIATLSKSDFEDITDTLKRRYDRGLHAFSEWDSGDLLQAYLGALTHAYDPHSDYFNTEHAQDFSIELSLSLFGIGAQLEDRDGYCTIAMLVSGGPAAKSKLLKENDRILAVAQGGKPPVDVVDMELGKVVQLIRGPKDTEVRLTISSADDPGARHVVSLVRDEIKLEDSEAKAQLIESPDSHGGTNRIGVIDLPSFYAPVDLVGNEGHSTETFCSADVAKLIRKLERENVAGIVIDLRDNGGGSLEEAIKFVGLFIKDGPVVLVRAPDGRVAVDDDDDPSVLYTGPLVVLVNRFSASAAEIAAAALQDYGRALIVGDTSTHGKGTVQSLNPLRPFVWQKNESASNDPGTVKITIRKFYRVSGASTQLKGVTPDIVLPDALSYSAKIGETSLENPLPWDTIPSVDYEKLNLVQPYVADLRKLSKADIATNQDFIYIRQDIDEFQKMQADNTATLNERDALKERQTSEARQKARDAERAARKPANEKIYEITVENSHQPGLPPPDALTTTNGVTDTFGSNFTNYLGTNAAARITSQNTEVKKVAGAVLKSRKAEVKTLPSDPTLNETENILEEYISLLSSNRMLIAN